MAVLSRYCVSPDIAEDSIGRAVAQSPPGCHSEKEREDGMEDANEAVRALITEPIMQQRLAKYLVHECFLNSELENLHTGIVPRSKTGDYSDVIVRTPFGDVPWPALSRFDDAEMKRLMIDVVNRTYGFIHRLFDEDTGGELWLRLGARDLVPQWENPTLPATKPRRARDAGRDLSDDQS